MLRFPRRIAEEAGKRYPAYNILLEVLGINSDPSALASLAEILIITEWASWRKIKNYYGMWKRDRRTYFHRSRTARQALERLTIRLKGHKIRGNDLKEVLKTIWLTLKTQKAEQTTPARWVFSPSGWSRINPSPFFPLSHVYIRIYHKTSYLNPRCITIHYKFVMVCMLLPTS